MKPRANLSRAFAAGLILALAGGITATVALMPSPAAAEQKCKRERKCTREKTCQVVWRRYKTTVCRKYSKKVKGETVTGRSCGPGYKKRKVNRCTYVNKCKRVRVCS